METTRREFLKTTAIAGTAVALPGMASASMTANPPEASMVEAAPPIPILSTRGIGVYPGEARENFDPVLRLDTAAPYRNLALLRPAFASSSYDYNLTAQLVTDGLAEARLPDWITTIIGGRTLPRHERESLVDHAPENVVEITTPQASVEFHLGGGVRLPEVDRIGLFVVLSQRTPPESLRYTVSVSEDGHLWRQVGSATGGTLLDPANFPPDMVRGSVPVAPSIALSETVRSRFYRVEFSAGSSQDAEEGQGRTVCRVGQVEFYRGAERVQIGGPYSFTSAWKSAGLDEEWIYADLGASFPIDRVKLHWIARAAAGKLQASDDAVSWHDLQPLPFPPSDAGMVDDLGLAAATRARYVRVLMTQPATEHGYILSELEVFGHGGFTTVAAAGPSGAGLTLSGGKWRLQRAPQVEAAGEAIAQAGFADHSWVMATVPGTVLTSYFNVGAVPDPNFGQNQLHISDSFFYADFWYRTEFATPARPAGSLAWLSFEGINWKAEVYLNGKKLGNIDGGFRRGKFEVCGLLRNGGDNALAVLIRKNKTPGSCKQKTFASTGKNGGGLGADNPTYHASIGWDWIPTIRGRNIGIWADVALTTTGAVTLEDPLVTSVVPDASRAEVSLTVVAMNHTAQPVSGTLRGRFGAIALSYPVKLAANERREITLSPATHAALRIPQPELWWPVGYGEPRLHDVEMRFEVHGKVQHSLAFKAGIRQMTATEDDGRLRLFINGRRFIARGGNWGFGESMLRYRAREYDAAVRYHREQNFTMIRDWVGQIGDESFYEACDRHGVVVWQDFWLANPWDGPIPADNALFLANARDYLLKIRRHASIGLYCGRNEWFPPTPLETGLRQMLAELHPGIHYIGSSADGPVSGHGPYHTLSAPNYFRTADRKLHSEIGAPTIPPVESVEAMMPRAAMWPQGLDWGLHDFTLSGAQGGTALLTLIEESYGGAKDAEEWIALAQFLNYDTYRAIFEAQSTYRMGVLLWMSHPCWPSFVWQTYDFYLEPTAAYFGCRKGSEPLHIQWNSHAETIEVVNYSAGAASGLTARVEVLNMDGKSAMQKSFPLNSLEDSTTSVSAMEYPSGLSEVHFLRLTLMQGEKTVSTNFYMRGREAGDYRAIRTLGKAEIESTTSMEQSGAEWILTTTLHNPSPIPALMVRLKATQERSGDRILPVLYDENYIALMPGELRTVRTRLNDADTRGERPHMVVEGFNVAARKA